MKFILNLLLLIALPVLADRAAEGSPQTPVKGMTPDARTGGGVAGGVNSASIKLASRLPAIGVPLAGDADFIDAHDAFLANDTVKLDRLAKRLKNSPLEVYTSYYQLRLSLENIDTKPVISPSTLLRTGLVEGPVLMKQPAIRSDYQKTIATPLVMIPAEEPVPSSIEEAVKKFLSRPEDTPMIDLLRIEWLKLLGKKQQWDLFDAEYPRLLNEDTELACYALQSRRRSQELATLRKARELWFTGKGQPDSCGPLFNAALTAGIISEQEVSQRLRLALEMNNVTLATKLAEQLDTTYAGLSAALKSAAADPDRYSAKLTRHNADEGQRIITLFALQRLAKQSPDLAASRWAKIETYFPVTEQHYFYGRLAYEAARNLDGRALQWFKAAAYTPLDDHQSAWRVRAALRAQDWPEVLATVNAMNEQQQRESTWLYWKARALQALGRPVEAREIFAPLSGEYSFYGQLANEELSDSPVLSETVPAYKPDPQAIAAISALPGVQRTLALYRVGLRNEALEEWRWVLRNLNDRELLTAAEIAKRNEMYDRAIGAADKTVKLHDFSLRYLAPYRADLQVHIREHGLDEAWVYGLMRQESRFAASAKSDTGAAGLMQIMPGTARWAANKLGLKSYRNALIQQLDTNLRLGTYYMKTILSQSDNSPLLASAAYNAGPLRALQWRGDQPLEGAIYAETIPFEETREYVKKVMSNTVYYANQFGHPPRSLKQRLGIVAAKTEDNQRAIPNVP